MTTETIPYVSSATEPAYPCCGCTVVRAHTHEVVRRPLYVTASHCQRCGGTACRNHYNTCGLCEGCCIREHGMMKHLPEHLKGAGT